MAPVRLALLVTLTFAPASYPQSEILDATVLHAFNAGQVSFPECNAYRIGGSAVYGKSTFGSSYAGFVWTPADGMRQAPLLTDVNDVGVAVLQTATLDLVSGATTTIPGTSTHPVVHGYAINASGTVVGRIAKQLLNRQYDDYLAMSWSPAAGTQLCTVPDSRNLVHVNDGGLAVGHIYTAADRPQAFVVDLATGSFTNFSTLLPPDPILGYSSSSASFVSDAGHVVGRGYDGTSRRGFVWTASAGFVFLPGLNGGPADRVYPSCVDSQGRVVGSALDGNGDWRGFLWFPQGVMLDVNMLAAVSDNVVVTHLERISDEGWICGHGIVGSWSPPKGVVLRFRSCQPERGFDGAGSSRLSVCGQPLSAGNAADLQVAFAPPSSPGVVAVSTALNPVPLLGGTLATMPIVFTVPFVTDAQGTLRVRDAIHGGIGPATAYLQALIVDASGTLPPDFTNAVQVDLLP